MGAAKKKSLAHSFSSMNEARTIIEKLEDTTETLQQQVRDLLQRESNRQQSGTTALPPDYAPILAALQTTIKELFDQSFKQWLATTFEAHSTSVDARIADQNAKYANMEASVTAAVSNKISSTFDTLDAKMVGLAAELHNSTRALPQVQDTGMQEQLAIAMRELPERTSNLQNIIFQFPAPSASNTTPPTTTPTPSAITTAVNAAMKEDRRAQISRLKAAGKSTASLETAPDFDLAEHLVSINPVHHTKPNMLKVRVSSPHITKSILRQARYLLRTKHNLICFEDLTLSQRDYKQKLQPLFTALREQAVRARSKKPFWEGGLIRYYEPGATTAVDHPCNWDLSQLQQKLASLQGQASTSGAASLHHTRSRPVAAR